MQITFLTPKFRNVERNLHCDVVYIATKWVSSLSLDCNGVFALNACCLSDIFSSLTSKTSAAIGMSGGLVGVGRFNSSSAAIGMAGGLGGSGNFKINLGYIFPLFFAEEITY